MHSLDGTSLWLCVCAGNSGGQDPVDALLEKKLLNDLNRNPPPKVHDANASNAAHLQFSFAPRPVC